MKHPCQNCHRPVVFQTKWKHGRRHADKKHDLCRQCWKTLMSSISARQLAEAA